MKSRVFVVSNTNIFDALLPLALQNEESVKLTNEAFILDVSRTSRANYRNYELHTKLLLNFYSRSIEKVRVLAPEEFPEASEDSAVQYIMDFVAYRTMHELYGGLQPRFSDSSSIQVCTSMADLMLASLPPYRTLYNPWLYKICRLWRNQLRELRVPMWAMPLNQTKEMLILGTPVERIPRQEMEELSRVFWKRPRSFIG